MSIMKDFSINFRFFSVSSILCFLPVISKYKEIFGKQVFKGKTANPYLRKGFHVDLFFENSLNIVEKKVSLA